jgi:hypothetical protein
MVDFFAGEKREVTHQEVVDHIQLKGSPAWSTFFNNLLDETTGNKAREKSDFSSKYVDKGHNL